MKPYFNMKTILFAITLFSFSALGQVNSWDVKLDSKGDVQGLVANKSALITFDAEYNPKSAELSPEATLMYLTSYHGYDALWNYLKSVGKLSVFTPDSGKRPPDR